MAEKTKENVQAPAPGATAGRTGEGAPKVHWDDTNMATAYANVVNVASTREEVTLFFGTNQTWNIADTNDVTVRLSNRLVLNPYAAKRLSLLLNGVLTEYESRFGTIAVDTRGTTTS